MPFDPNLPQPGTEMDANQMRAQLNALNDEIAAIPAGPQGAEGPQGPEGPPGPPGEVTSQRLDAAIAGTARNPDALNPLTQTISDPPTQAEVQALQDFCNALLAALYRPPV